MSFNRLDQCRDVDHDDDEEKAHENRATDEKCDMALVVWDLRCCHVARQYHESDKQQHSEYKSCDVSRGDRRNVSDVHVRPR